MKEKRLSLVFSLFKGFIMFLVLSALVFAITSTYRLNTSIDNTNRNIISNYTNQIANRVRDRFERINISLKYLSSDIDNIEGSNFNDFAFQLNSYEEIWDVDLCGVMFTDGRNVLSTGELVEFKKEIIFERVLTTDNLINITHQVISGHNMLLIVEACNKEDVVAVFAAINVEDIENLLDAYGYGEYSFLALTKQSGNNIYKQGPVEEGSNGNCFSDLSKLTIDSDDSINEMQESMNNLEDGTLSYIKRGEEYYLAYVPLGVNQWYLLVSTIATSIDLTKVARDYFVVAVILIALIIVMTLVGSAYLLKKNKDMSHYNKQLQKTTLLANQASEAKRMFLAKVTHEIRTPLNGVMGMVALAKDATSDKQKCLAYLEKAISSASYLQDILNDVLDMSRIESGKEILAREIVDLKKMRQEILGAIEFATKEKNITLNVNDDDLKHFYFYGDYTKVRQIITNLLSNAVKYTKNGGSIYLELKEEIISKNILPMSEIIIKIKDTGIGISKDKVQDIFNPFEQINVNTNGGVGLGLSIVKSYVELMKGEITVESTINEGSTFIITLPLEISLEKRVVEEEPVGSLDGLTILLAEDNFINAEITIELLKNKGACVSLATDGVKVVEEFKKSKEFSIDCILMDIQMPNKNGIEATVDIRHLNRSDSLAIPIIALTANAFDEQKEELLTSGINDYLFKPVDIDKITSCILKWVNKKKK